MQLPLSPWNACSFCRGQLRPLVSSICAHASAQTCFSKRYLHWLEPSILQAHAMRASPKCAVNIRQPYPEQPSPSPALALSRRTRGDMTNAAADVHVAGGGLAGLLAVVSITVRKSLPGWISLGHGWQSSAQLLVPPLPQETDVVFFPLSHTTWININPVNKFGVYCTHV